MNKSMQWIVCFGIVAVVLLWGTNVYNGLIEGEEDVSSAWGRVENHYHRRSEIAQTMLTVVGGEVKEDVVRRVHEARLTAAKILIDPQTMTAEMIGAYATAQEELGEALVILEEAAGAHPVLRNNAHYREVLGQLESSENRIIEAREQFNATTEHYNAIVRRFPSDIVAVVFGFEKKPYFEAQ